MIRYESKARLSQPAYCPHCGNKIANFDRVSYGNIVLNDTDEVFFEGKRMELTKNQHVIIDALVRAKGRLVTYSVLALAMGSEIFDNTVSANIGRTRMKFRSVNHNFDQLQVVRGFGAYRWVFRNASTFSIGQGSHALDGIDQSSDRDLAIELDTCSID